MGLDIYVRLARKQQWETYDPATGLQEAKTPDEFQPRCTMIDDKSTVSRAEQ